MRILVGCELSGRVRDAFRERGHNAWSCDTLPQEDYPLSTGREHIFHIEGDILDAIHNEGPWDMVIAHPPCTYLCNSGVQHLHDVLQPERWGQMVEGAELFRDILNCGVKRICVENPIPHGEATDIIGRKYTQIVQPFHFGHFERKATCLWLEGLPPLTPTKDVEAVTKLLPPNYVQKMWWEGAKGDLRAHIRSVTYQGLADAMALQWG